MNKNKQRRLSEKAIQEFRGIYQEEFGELLTDDQAEGVSLRVLRLFQILATDLRELEPATIPVSEIEFAALRYIHRCLFHENRQPAVRGIADALKRRSSRSGFRMLDSLTKRGLVWQNEGEGICMKERSCEVWKCCE